MSERIAYIGDVVECAEGSAVELRPVFRTPAGQRLVWMADGHPDHEAARVLRERHDHVFAVHVIPKGSEEGCIVLVGTVQGPRWVRASLGAGLALCQSGVHGVLRDLAQVVASDAGQQFPLESAC